ncbi:MULTISPECIES: FecR family protein [Bacteroides]|uniref:FecR family protein n=1 Tax=Bacteroides TaxID=816 RepID=UPI001D4FE7C0|nr:MULTISPECIES: FecR family protein [Bacteroides]HJD92919.1 FecR family protein [Bacteroides coprosuis]
MNDTIDIDVLMIKYWDGTAEIDEKEQLLTWLQQSDTHKQEFRSKHKIWLTQEAASISKSEIYTALKDTKQSILQSSVSSKIGSILPWLYRVAAVFILAFATSFFFLNYTSIGEKEVLVNKVIMPQGSKGVIGLPDGSKVWLNSGSSLSYKEDFLAENREVSLDGEAYFEVEKNKAKPFVVKTANVNVEVLGTKFDVQNYLDSDEVKVTLIEGSVKIASDRKDYILKPNEKYVLSKSNKAEKVEMANGMASRIWINQRISFEKKLLKDIIPYLESWYGVEFIYNSSFENNTHLTFTIREDTLNDILKSIEYISNIEFEIKENKVIIK